MTRITKSTPPQTGIFVADICTVPFKDDVPSMEHPLFALKAGDRKAYHYEHNGYSIAIRPTELGRATIHDKDIWIYCIGLMVEARNCGQSPVSRTVQFTVHDCLRTIGRSVGGENYKRFVQALGRLRGTYIETNITTGKRRSAGFGLIDSWEAVESENGKVIAVRVDMPLWLVRSVENNDVLTLSREYFSLQKPLEKRLYELARKHCGKQVQWQVSLKTLHQKSGSASALKRFRLQINNLIKAGTLPDYLMTIDAKRDVVIFYPKQLRGRLRHLNDVVKG